MRGRIFTGWECNRELRFTGGFEPPRSEGAKVKTGWVEFRDSCNSSLRTSDVFVALEELGGVGFGSDEDAEFTDIGLDFFHVKVRPPGKGSFRYRCWPPNSRSSLGRRKRSQKSGVLFRRSGAGEHADDIVFGKGET